MNIYIYIYIYIYIKRCVEKKRSLVCHNKVAKYLLNSTSLKKNTEAATGSEKAVTEGVL